MKKIVMLAILLSVVNFSFGQSKESKWVLGVSGSFVNFGDSGPENVGERFNFQIPKINLSRYVFKSIILDAGVTIGTISELGSFYSNSFDYFSVDGAIRYDFNMTNEIMVPYLTLGASIVGAPSTIPNSQATATINYGAGATYWISHHWGINVQALYKFSPDEYESMSSHAQVSAGIVYSFNPRQLVYRLWDTTGGR